MDIRSGNIILYFLYFKFYYIQNNIYLINIKYLKTQVKSYKNFLVSVGHRTRA
jgi:sRNA-binding regulator protein Hfq